MREHRHRCARGSLSDDDVVGEDAQDEWGGGSEANDVVEVLVRRSVGWDDEFRARVSVELRGRGAAGGAAVGVVFNPVVDEMFTAVRGWGAFVDGGDSVQQTEALGRSLIGTKLACIEQRRWAMMMGPWRRGVGGAFEERSVFGIVCDEHVQVAMGRLDGFFEIGFGGPWDCVAGTVIVFGRESSSRSSGQVRPIRRRRVLCANATSEPILA